MEKERAVWAIEALEKATKIEILVVGLEENDFCMEMRKLAEAIQKQNHLDESVMEQYDIEIQKANDAAEIPDAELSLGDIECLNEAAFELCDSLEDPKQIMCNIRLIWNVMYLWSPMCEKG